MDIYIWRKSAKGNSYTEVGKYLCVVGKSKIGWWALVKDQFLPQKFNTEEEAKEAALTRASMNAELDDVLEAINECEL